MVGSWLVNAWFTVGSWLVGWSSCQETKRRCLAGQVTRLTEAEEVLSDRCGEPGKRFVATISQASSHGEADSDPGKNRHGATWSLMDDSD